MSFLDTSRMPFGWTPAPLQTSVRREAGCVQCGNRLEMNEFGKYDASGKCFSCANWVSEEEEELDDYED